MTPEAVSADDRMPLLWLGAVTLGAAVVDGTVRGAYSSASAGPLWVSTLGGLVGLAGSSCLERLPVSRCGKR